MRRSLLQTLFYTLIIGKLAAQDGGQLYATYCSACHAEDGAGATGGAFPPLAGSRWVTSDPAISTKIVLHGIQGPIDVLGKTYNLEMPPQGAVLPDDQIAAILTYIRGAWGNGADPVSTEFVKEIRAANQDRKISWTADELLKAHPLPFEKTALINLTSQYYLGHWNDIPDFSKLKPENVEEEHDGVLSISHAPATDDFGIVWNAEFVAPADGKYTFMLDADDGARVLIDGKVLVEVRGTGPMDGSRAERGEIDLKKGPVPIRIEFFEAKNHESLVLGWRGPGVKDWRWLTEDTAQSRPEKPKIPIRPSENRAAIYRNFIDGSTARAIGIGFPGGPNLAWSADHLAPERIWTGEFMDGGLHWVERGQGNQEPAGDEVVTLSNAPAFALRSETSQQWPQTSNLTATFKGYKLDAAGNPTFSIDVGTFRVLDAFNSSGGKSLHRVIKVVGRPTAESDLLIARGIPITPGETPGSFRIDNRLTINSSQPLRYANDILILPLTADASVEIRYTWD